MGGKDVLMNPNDYQDSAARTICPQTPAVGRLMTDPQLVQLNHALVGLTGEIGELHQLLEKHLWYGQPLDKVKMFEEYGDALWYVCEGLSALGFELGRVMEANLKKLKVRYPSKFTEGAAAERDLAAEIEAIKTSLGISQPDTVPVEVTEAEAHCTHEWNKYQQWDNGESLRMCTKCRIQEFVPAAPKPE